MPPSIPQYANVLGKFIAQLYPLTRDFDLDKYLAKEVKILHIKF